MKLTRPKVLELLRLYNEGVSIYQLRKRFGVTKQRVYQVIAIYERTGEPPDLGRQVGRPCRPILLDEQSIVEVAYRRYRVGADALERLINRDNNVHLPHNHIQRVLVVLGYAQPLGTVHIRKKKWRFYERKHSLTAIHIDWHQRTNGVWVLAIIDDASRKMLVLIECTSPTVEITIRGMELALTFGQIRECISDHGSQFTNNREGESQFKNWLDAHDIKQILARIKHPQTNGKVERWFDTYETHRDAFPTVEAMLEWYNNIRPHRSLNWNILETPNMAFERKKRAEV